MSLAQTDHAAAAGQRAALERLGYEVRFRSGVWLDCLVCRDDEAWLGAGLTEEDALRAAVRKAFPSHGARQLLEGAIASSFPMVPVAAPTSEVRLSRDERPPEQPVAHPPEEAPDPGVGEHAEPTTLEARRCAVLRAAPSASVSDEDLREWVVALLTLSDGALSDEVSTMRPLAGRIAGMPPVLPKANRRVHRRFKRLRAALLELDGARVQGPGAPLVPTADDRLSLVVARTRGARVAFLGNRSDGTLRAALLRRFAFVELDMFESGAADRLSARVAAGSYDLVLAATGFLDHSVAGKVARACKTQGVPCVAVNRGRVGAVLSALARAYGVDRVGGRPAGA